MPQLLALVVLLLPGSALALQLYSFKVIEKQAQPRELFTQGLEIDGKSLYLSTGRYGKSRLLRYEWPSGALNASARLSRNFFGEGLTVLNEHVYQLTWRAKKMLIYRKQDLKLLGSHALPGDGWGLTNDGASLIYSDGSATLRWVDPDSGAILRTVEARQNGQPLSRLNELEWVNGTIWSNIWLTNRLAIIDPTSGNVTGIVDLTGLLPEKERIAGTDVLNGIAYDKVADAIWVTGKHWPWRYQIALIPSPDNVSIPDNAQTKKPLSTEISR